MTKFIAFWSLVSALHKLINVFQMVICCKIFAQWRTNTVMGSIFCRFSTICMSLHAFRTDLFAVSYQAMTEMYKTKRIFKMFHRKCAMCEQLPKQTGGRHDNRKLHKQPPLARLPRLFAHCHLSVWAPSRLLVASEDAIGGGKGHLHWFSYPCSPRMCWGKRQVTGGQMKALGSASPHNSAYASTAGETWCWSLPVLKTNEAVAMGL